MKLNRNLRAIAFLGLILMGSYAGMMVCLTVIYIVMGILSGMGWI